MFQQPFIFFGRFFCMALASFYSPFSSCSLVVPCSGLGVELNQDPTASYLVVCKSSNFPLRFLFQSFHEDVNLLRFDRQREQNLVQTHQGLFNKYVEGPWRMEPFLHLIGVGIGARVVHWRFCCVFHL